MLGKCLRHFPYLNHLFLAFSDTSDSACLTKTTNNGLLVLNVLHVLHVSCLAHLDVFKVPISFYINSNYYN